MTKSRDKAREPAAGDTERDVVAPGSGAGAAAVETTVPGGENGRVPAAPEGHEPVPMWLAVLVLALLLAIMGVGGWLLRGAFSGDRATDPAVLEVREWEDRVSESPEDAQAQLNLAFAYQKARRYRDALDRYDMVLRNDPRNAAALYNKGIILLELDRDEEAEETLWDVLGIDEGHVLASSALGELYAARGHYRSLVKAVRPAAEAHPEAADLQYLMGLAYENLGRADWAEARYRLALKYVPDLQKAKDGLARLGVEP